MVCISGTMAENTRYQRLTRMLNPRGIAFVGGEALEPAIAYTRALGFAGDYFVINPDRDQLGGIDCVRTASALPGPPDVAFVAVPGAAAIDVVRELAEAGVGATIVNSSGFSESGTDGAKLEAELIAAAGDMPLFGPNCPGFANFLDRVSAMMGHMGDCQASRGVAVVSNGGAYLADITNSDRSLPIAYIAGLGNQGSISIAELLDVILDDDRVTAVHLHFESIRDVSRLSESALKAHQKGIPIVALKAGKSSAGSRAAQSHTASLTGAAQIASALFTRLGFVEVESASEALETLKILTLAPAPKGPRVGYATSSGTYAVMGADFAEKNGLTMPPISDQTRARLQPLIDEFLVADNPLDIASAQFWPDDAQQKIFATFFEDDYDIALQTMSFPPENTWEDESWYRSATTFATTAQAAGLPAIFVSPTQEGLPKRAREMLIELGAVPLQGFECGMKAIANALTWHRRRKALNPNNLLLPEPPAETRTIPSTLDEAESKSLLAAFGIAVPNGVRWSAQAELPENLNYPVVLKVCDATILHKSDIGGVSQNLVSAELLSFAREQMLTQFEHHGYQAENFLVEESIRGVIAELLIGIHRVPGIGLSLTLAIGGVAVELLDDSVNLLLPSDRTAIADALSQLKLYPAMVGLHGTISANIDS